MFAAGSLQARTAWWKPERTLGSAQLSLEEMGAIYLPAEPSARLKAAAEDLAMCWPAALEQRHGEASKQALVLLRDHGSDRLGRSLFRGGMKPHEAKPFKRRDTGGFSFRRERSRVYVKATTDEALADGLYAICRELLGARWYWAGDLGFETVGDRAEKFPDRIWRERPAFVQRTLYPVGTDFGRRNGLNRKYSFNHNLARIFTPAVYATSPEVFAEIGGERQRPKGSAGTDAQPDFTEPKTVELAVAAARQYFEENPQSNSFSLSINDNSLFDEGERTARAVDGGPSTSLRAGRSSVDGGREKESGRIEYFRGRPNYTDLVFGFMNQVAENLYEGKNVKGRKGIDLCSFSTFDFPTFTPSHPSSPYLTALAYYWTEQSPSFEIHPRVMPVLTSDRAQWHDPEYRAQDKALIRRWANSGAERIATWDYYFGAPYPYPRQFTQWIGASIPFLHEAGVDVFFSQLPSVWGLDGPKAWLTAELLRDPGQAVGDLLDEYYNEFFGPAAEPIRKFYEIAEQTRNERAGTANWIKFYKDEAGIELFDKKTLMRMRACIDEASERVAEEASSGVVDSGGSDGLPASRPHTMAVDRFAKRVQVVSEAFSYTESYAAYHRSRVALVERAIAGLDEDARNHEASALLRALAEYQGAKNSFNALKRVLAAKPLHKGLSTFNRLKQSDPMPLVLAALSKTNSESIFSKNSSGSENSAQAGRDELRLDGAALSALDAWREDEAGIIPYGKNPSLKHSGRERRNFLGPEVPVIEGWNIEYRASEELRIVAATGQKNSGLRIENADIVSLSQTYPVLGKKIYLLEINANWRISPDNRTRMQLNWESIGGEKLRTDLPLRIPSGSSRDVQHLQFVVSAPVNAYDLKVGIVTNRQYTGDYLEIQRIELGQLVPER